LIVPNVLVGALQASVTCLSPALAESFRGLFNVGLEDRDLKTTQCLTETAFLANLRAEALFGAQRLTVQRLTVSRRTWTLRDSAGRAAAKVAGKSETTPSAAAATAVQ
jgi:hypothetical protein